MSNYFLGIDLGTTGTKVILMREDGKIIDKKYTAYDILNPEPEFAEQNPRDWWQGLCDISRLIVERNQGLINKIAGIGIDGQMHTQVYLDSDGQPLRNAITWMDQRSSKIVRNINSDRQQRELIFNSTANYLNTTYSAPNIKWVQENEIELYQKTEKILLAKDYLKYLLTGEMVTDYSDAAGTMLFDVVAKKWSAEMFELFRIKRSLMPAVDKSTRIIGKVTAEASKATGIPEGILVINGCADQAATSLGAGASKAGEVTAIIGTAGVISVLSDRPVADPNNGTLCWNYCLDNKWINLGIMQTAGESLNWFKRAFDREADNDIFDE